MSTAAPVQLRPSRRGDIQGLRALAVGLVIVAHAGFSQIPGGFVGVDVFFVLSGFLITGLLMAEADRTGRVSISAFYARRARRILPAATVTLVAVLLWGLLREPFGQFAALVKDSLWSAVFLSNVHFANEKTDYFSDTGISPVRHFWSLSVEEQFYVVWPLLVLGLLLLGLRRRVLVITMVAIVVASLAWSVWLTHSDPQAAYFSTPARAHELGLGALLALITPLLVRMRPWCRHALAWGGLAAILLAALVYTESTPFPSWRALLPVLGTLALLAAGTGREVGLSLLFGRQPLRYLGDLSFSLYLWHWPILVFGRPHVEQWGLRGTFLLLTLTLVASAASYHFVEQPFQRGTVPRLTGNRYLVLWPVSLVLVACTAWASTQYGDHRQEQARAESEAFYRNNPDALAPAPRQPVAAQIRQALALADQGAPIPTNLRRSPSLQADMGQGKQACFASDPATSSALCQLGDVTSNRTMVLLGDSHAGMWLPAFDTIAKRQGYRLVPLLKLGCAPYDVPQHLADGSAFPQCPAFRDWSARQLAELDPDVLVVAHRAMLFMDGGSVSEQRKLWSAGVEKSMAEWTAAVPQVRVLADIPVAPWRPRDCLSAPGAKLIDCVLEQQGFEIDGDVLTRAAVTAAGGRWVDTLGLICREDRCPLVVGNVVTYRDDAHLSGPWVRRVSRDLGRLLDLPASR